MADERLLNARELKEDKTWDLTLRPRTLADYVGQNQVKENLKIKDVIVDGGPILKRFRPKGFGSTSPIEKRTSHITESGCSLKK